MRIKKLFIVASGIISIVLFACKHDIPQQPVTTSGGTSTGSGGGTGSTPVCFESEILPLFQSYCAKSNCHDQGSHQDGYVLDSYDNLFKKEGRFNSGNIKPGDPLASKLYKVFFETGNEKMPPPGNADMDDNQKNLIARWITEGAKLTTNCRSTCDSTITPVSFKNHIQPILQNNCTGCHSGTAPAGGIDLTTYLKVKLITTNGVNSQLYGVIAHLPGYRPMPKIFDANEPDKTKKLSLCEIALVRKWLVAGAQDN